MICEECNTNEARFAVTMNINGETCVRHLCPSCMQAMNSSLRGGNVAGVLAAILSAITSGERRFGTEEQPEEAVPDITCPKCGTSYASFHRSGRLGCPGCYVAFREQLQPMLQQIHGRVQHAGRLPLENAEAQRSRSRQEELTRLMQQAVALEDFETAAQLRDQIHALAAEGGEHA